MLLDQPESELRVKEEWAKEENMGRGIKLDRNVSCSLFQVPSRFLQGDPGTQTSMRPKTFHSYEEPFQECHTARQECIPQVKVKLSEDWRI